MNSILSTYRSLPDRVERDADGLPVAWQVLPFGDVKVRQTKGDAVVTDSFSFTAAKAAAIVADHQRQGAEIPLDCEHATRHAAAEYNANEIDLATLPLIGERFTAAFLSLEARADGLWATVRRWTDRGRELMKAGAYRYFSPVIHDKDGAAPVVSSIALTNVPAIANLPALVAAANANPSPKPKDTPRMEPLYALLAAFCGVTADAEGKLPGNFVDIVRMKLDEIKDKLADEEAEVTEPLCAMYNAVGLDRAKAKLAELAAAIKAKVDAAAMVPDLQAKVEAFSARETKATLDALIADGLKARKLTAHMAKEWAPKQTVDALSAYLAAASPVIPGGTTEQTREAQPLDPALVTIARMCGVDPTAAAAVKLPALLAE